MTINPDQYTDAIKSSQQQYSDALKNGQEAWTSAVEQWTKTLSSAFSQAQGAVPTTVDAGQVIDQVFDFMATMLESQRQFAKNLANAGSSVSSALRQQAESVTNAASSSAEAFKR